MEKQSGVIYSMKCKDSDSLYIGESGRKLEKRLAEHTSKAASSKSAIRGHVNTAKIQHRLGERKSVGKGTKRFSKENLGSHPHQDFES